MAGLAEIVRRDAGNHGRLILVVQEKFLGIGPGVGAVHGHKDGDVPDDQHALFIGIVLQSQILAVEDPLVEFVGVNVCRMFHHGFVQRTFLAATQIDLPLIPGRTVVGIL